MSGEARTMAVVTATEPSAAQRKAEAAKKAAEAMEETEKAIRAAREQASAGALQGAGAKRARTLLLPDHACAP